MTTYDQWKTTNPADEFLGPEPEEGLTESQLARLTKDLSSIAKEPITVKDIKGAIYAFGSELACLRLFHRYNMVAHCPGCWAGYSENMGTWYFSLERRFT